MHMADALLSPAVGGTMWAATAVGAAYCAKKVRDESDPAKVPLMGVTGAFVFAAQMINFTIPGTGSSGHLGGGLLLAILLGPEAAFLVMASVLAVQALFFADGGLLALGANIFNLGFFPAFIALPLAYRPLAGDSRSRTRLVLASLAAVTVALQLGSLAVVLQTTASGISELPFGAFALTMQPIHLAIGLVEGVVTAGVVLFVMRAQPELVTRVAQRAPLTGTRLRPVVIGLLLAAIVAGGALSWLASSDPDGLEWSLERVAGTPEVGAASSAVHAASSALQDGTAFMPDYGFASGTRTGETASSWPAPDAGTSTAGLVGAGLTLGVAALLGLALRRRRPRADSQPL